MTQENTPPAPHRPTDTELEERIVAWVLGEASAFEIAALEAVVAARPEFAVFKRRIEAVHGLVAAAARENAAPLRLSPDRRARLLAVIGSAPAVAGGAAPGKTAAQSKSAAPTKPSVVRLPRPPERPWWRNEWFYSAAACVVISIGGFWMLGTVSPNKPQRPDPDAMLECIQPSAEEEAPDSFPEPPGDVPHFELTVPTRSMAPIAANYSWSAPKAATAPRVAPKPNLVFGTFGTTDLDRKKEVVVSGFSQFSEQTGESDASSAAGYASKTVAESSGVLDKFEVNETESRGYTATNTLGGTRLRTELKDISSSISVVTKQFMKDVGATNKESVLGYSGNAEVGGLEGNFAGKPAAPRDNFLSKRKTERIGGKGGAPAPAAPAVGGEAEEVVVLSPFSVASSQDSGYLRSNRAPKLPKRPAPSATTAGMGPGGLQPTDVDLNLQAAASTTSTPSTQSTPFALAESATDHPLPRPAQKLAAPPPSTDETSAAHEPVSTFSLHVSDASFKLALTALAAGRLPDAASIRPEEFYNAFDYGDPAPGAGEKVSCRLEQAAHPFAQQRNLVRIAVRVPATGRGSGTPLNLTVLLDTSGSMERPDRRAAVRAALRTLVGLLGPADRLTLVGFARQPRLLAEALDGNHANQALDFLDRTPAEGGTNLEEALKLGGELARRHFAEAAQNRIVLLTDGAANLGNADPERLAAAIETLRSQRIAFDACGVGLEGVDDDMLEALTRKGDGRYYVLDSPEAADAGFARQLAGAFRPAAENVKLQVRFNPARVGRYRLVGFEKHRLREEDFRNDAVDAAELAAEEAAVALYEVEVLPQGEGEVAEVLVRFRDTGSKEMVERGWTVPYEPRAAAFDRASSSLQLAGTAAALAEKLRGGAAGDRVDLDALAPFVAAQRARRPDDKRLQELATLFEQLRRMKR
ncbi:MAG TPA: von Willebrand factor type A domain-containing protein [Opitutaceae bacterium]|nr:von Willebrand factor type A domain-containing protein [Opitutaceae bacterium]